jgi:ribosomal protein L2
MFLKFCKIGYKRKNGRNHRGFIVFRRRGGFGLVVYRYIDFFLYLAFFLSYIVIDFCYDTCRNSFLMCVLYLNGVFSYRLGIEKVTCGSLFDSYSSNFFGSVNLIIRQPVGHYLCNIPFVFGKQIFL